MKEDKPKVFEGPSFFTLLTLLFIGLKLTGYITWSWWWVLSPMWLPFLVAVMVAAIVVFFSE